MSYVLPKEHTNTRIETQIPGGNGWTGKTRWATCVWIHVHSSHLCSELDVFALEAMKEAVNGAPLGNLTFSGRNGCVWGLVLSFDVRFGVFRRGFLSLVYDVGNGASVGCGGWRTHENLSLEPFAVLLDCIQNVVAVRIDEICPRLPQRMNDEVNETNLNRRHNPPVSSGENWRLRVIKWLWTWFYAGRT